MGEEQVTSQRVQALAFVELPPDSAAEFYVSNVSAEVDGANEPAVFLQGAGEPIAAHLDKGQALDLRWTIIGLFISVVRGSATRRDPQALSTLWIVIIRQHWRKSMLHSASFLELDLLITLRWYVIRVPSALGNHHNNQTRRNDRHNRRRRGPAGQQRRGRQRRQMFIADAPATARGT